MNYSENDDKNLTDKEALKLWRIGYKLFFMSRLVTKNILLVFSILLVRSILAETEDPSKLVRVSLQKYSHQNQSYLALNMRHQSGWHTYWKNPGDAGTPTKVTIEGLSTTELPWPAPKRYLEKGNIVTFGYQKEITRFFAVKKVERENIKVEVKYLACKHICIPGKQIIEAKWNTGKSKLADKSLDPFTVSSKKLKKRFLNLPSSANWPDHLKIDLFRGTAPNSLLLAYTDHNAQTPPDNGMLIPYSADLVTFKHEVLSHNSGKLAMIWDGELEDPPVHLGENDQLPVNLNLQFLYQGSQGKRKIIKKTFSSINTTQKLPATFANTNAQKTKSGFATYLLFAFIGGLILNVMPCVLPVISLKLFNLAAHSDESSAKILKHNIAYTAGTLLTFLILGLIVIALKAAGEFVGWGFQMQSPTFIALMILILFLLGLNLFGLFEFQTPGGRTLGNVQLKEGFTGDFISGILATVLATPCSAPFLGTALTFAFASSALNILIIFLFIGLGLAFPFIVIGIFPKSIAFLPRPGIWMEHLKKFLGLTLFLAVLWLLKILHALVDDYGLVIKFNVALLFFFFAFYLRKNITKNFYCQLVSFALPIFLLSQFIYGNIRKENTDELSWLPWSEEKMREEAERKNTAFLNFTAEWCLTCKINEKILFDTDEFKMLIKEKEITLLLGDWTKRDENIEHFLKRNGFVGVPAYFVQDRCGNLISLGELPSLDKIKKAITAGTIKDC